VEASAAILSSSVSPWWGLAFPIPGDDGNSVVIRVTAFAPSLLRW